MRCGSMIGPNFVWRCVFQNLPPSDGQSKDCCQLITGFLIRDLCEMRWVVYLYATHIDHMCVYY